MTEDNHPSAGAKAYRAMKEMILDGRLKPSASYLETELADWIGVSRTPVREAALRLEREGLVKVRPRRGIQVLPVSAEDMNEIYQLLSALEPLAAQLAAEKGLDEATMAAMTEATERMETALEENDLVSWAEADDAFHALLVEASGNARLIEATARYRTQVHRARMATLTMRPTPQKSTEDHRALLDCLLNRDPEGARAVHYAHRCAAGEMLTELLSRHHLDNL
ncbi:MAG: GntR family transcriptional regulator [Nisaea sp.]|jgi:DNA-binding GntR family transcriptional regulator|uniref:GntR family transcriptional regulator n=1 Tax=Nisaea sp. TaxID=2024842 RepID=UPI001B19F2C0|nr:GntR family transcriptional regulator [Nisaea sp.]MBO6559694.1 GntR family transcriptional regulator [Nisaea sp.]